MVEITGIIKRAIEQPGNWDFVLVGKILGQKDNDRFSLFLQLTTVEKLFHNNRIELIIESANVDPSSEMAMMVFKSKETFFAGAPSTLLLAEDLVIKKSVDKYTFPEKVALLSRALRFKSMVVEMVIPKGTPVSTDYFYGEKKISFRIIISDK